MICIQCKKETTNPKFCSRSCSSKYLNKSENGRKTGRKRINTTKCKYCQSITQHKNRAFCQNCTGKIIKTCNGSYVKITEATKYDVTTNDTQKYRRIREHARKQASKFGLLNECYICGYSNYVECAHRQSINSFSDKTLLMVINDRLNLVGLCPNHHWEFDNGFLYLK